MTTQDRNTVEGLDDSPRRSAFVAIILSLLVPGLGHLYAGQTRRAAVLFLIFALLGVVLTLCLYGVLPRFWILVSAVVLMLCLYLFSIIDSALKARRIAIHPRGPYDRWYIYVGILALMVVGDWGLDRAVAALTSGPGYYEIPSASMAPTLRPGETLLADTLYYRSRPPQRGDVVVFTHPKQPDVRHIFRVIALGGERVSVSGGRSMVNGAPADEPFADFGDGALAHNNMPEMIVPRDTVFVLGDNRANSADSRQADALGPVPVGNLIGRVTNIVLSLDFSRVGQWVGTPRRL